jgi:hypothetical protein
MPRDKHTVAEIRERIDAINSLRRAYKARYGSLRRACAAAGLNESTVKAQICEFRIGLKRAKMLEMLILKEPLDSEKHSQQIDETSTYAI